jgi:hypothetical protein
MRVGNCPQSLTEKRIFFRGIVYHVSNIEVLCSVKQRKEFRISDTGLRPRVPHLRRLLPLLIHPYCILGDTNSRPKVIELEIQSPGKNNNGNIETEFQERSSFPNQKYDACTRARWCPKKEVPEKEVPFVGELRLLGIEVRGPLATSNL